MVERLTDKKLQNKRFRTTEESIIIAICATRDMFSLNRLIKTAGISRATRYRRHGNINRIVPNYESYILRKNHKVFSRLIKNRHIHLRTLFERLFILMIAHKNIMQFILKYGRRDINDKIVMFIKPKILSTGKVKDGEMFSVYLKEIVGIIEGWQVAGFRKQDVAPALDKIMYMTDTDFVRLRPLEDYNENTYT